MENIKKNNGCGRQYCPVCNEELIHRDHRKFYESSSGLGQIVYRDLPHKNFGVCDIDLVSHKTMKNDCYKQLIRIIEQKQSNHTMSFSQKTILSLLDKIIKHCIECPLADNLNLDSRSGVYLIRGSIAGSNKEKIHFDGPQIIKKFGSEEKIIINTSDKKDKYKEELHNFLNPSISCATRIINPTPIESINKLWAKLSNEKQVEFLREHNQDIRMIMGLEKLK